ncbi:MAG: class I SAM-dependent methyltransferase [Bacteroidetes bacterium]|nr:class I SAM-dependent methyltransferase [Bacteroidota bacterium]
MQATNEEIKEQQRQVWNKFSSGWKQWDEFVMKFLKPVGDGLIRSVSIEEDSIVLDVATGTGEPGLTASVVAKKGKVIGTDLSEEMIAVAMENARLRKIKNFSTVVCGAEKMPFMDEYFDAIIVRFGFMFFPDMLQCAKEMWRVLRRGKKISASVWAEPEKNPWASVIIGTVIKMAGIEPPPPDIPGLFRCAQPGLMTEVFQKAGFKRTEEKTINGTRDFENPEQYWNFMTAVAAPVVSGLNKVDEAKQQEIKDAVLGMVLKNFAPHGKVSFPWAARIITSQK